MAEESNTATVETAQDNGAAQDQSTAALQQYIDDCKAESSPESTQEHGDQDGKGSTGSDSTSEAADKTPAGDEKATRLTEAQVQAAMHLGYDDDEIAQISPQEAKRLERQSANQRKLESKMGRLEKKLQAAKAAPDGSGDGKDIADKEPAKDETPEPEEVSPDDDLDTVARKINAIRKHSLLTRQENQALKKQLTTYREEAQEPVMRQVASEIDAYFDGLDQEIFAQFGKGKLSELDEDAPETAARKQIIKAGRGIMAALDELGEEATTAQCLDAAMYLLAREQHTKAAQKPIREQFDKRAKGGAAKPSGNATMPKDVDPETEVKQKLVEFARSRGHPMKE